MTFAIEICRRFYLQFRSLDIAIQYTAPFQQEQVFHFDRPRHLPHDVRRLAVDIALDIPIGADDDLCRTMDVSYQRPVDPQIAVAGDVSLHGGAGADQAGARAY